MDTTAAAALRDPDTFKYERRPSTTTSRQPSKARPVAKIIALFCTIIGLCFLASLWFTLLDAKVDFHELKQQEVAKPKPSQPYKTRFESFRPTINADTELLQKSAKERQDKLNALKADSQSHLCPSLLGNAALFRFRKLIRDASSSKYHIAAVFGKHTSVSHMAFQLVQLVKFFGSRALIFSLFEHDLQPAPMAELRALLRFLDRERVNFRFEQVKEENGTPPFDLIKERLDARLKQAELSNSQLIIVNDVVFCAGDIVELIYERERNDADLMCGFSFGLSAKNRLSLQNRKSHMDLGGELFGSLPSSKLVKDRESAKLLWDMRSFEVFSCWSPLMIMSPRLFQNEKVSLASFELVEETRQDNDCHASEEIEFAHRLHAEGFHKIAMVSSVRGGGDMKAFEKIHKKFASGMINVWTRNEVEKPISWNLQSQITVKEFCHLRGVSKTAF